MMTCGLTGGIGAGKSTTAELLARRGIPVIDTDAIARDLVRPGEPALNDIRASFGADFVDQDGSLRRDRLAEVVFSQADKRRELEAILHPRIRRTWEGRLADLGRQGMPLAFVMIPLLFETEAESRLSGVICVGCSESTQRARLTRRGWNEAQIRQRVAAQWPMSRKMDRADWVIWNESSLDLCEQQLNRVVSGLPQSAG